MLQENKYNQTATKNNDDHSWLGMQMRWKLGRIILKGEMQEAFVAHKTELRKFTNGVCHMLVST